MKQITGLSAIAEHFPTGTHVVVHTACAAPPLLSSQLVELAREQGPFALFDLTTIGTPRFVPGLTDGVLKLSTFVPGRAVRAILRAGQVEVVRRPLSESPSAFASGGLPVDVLLLHLSPPDTNGRMSLGISVDVMRAVLARNPIVVAEISEFMPRTCGDTAIYASDIDFWIKGGQQPQIVSSAEGDAKDGQIADHIAGLIRNGDVLQTGIGAIPDLTVTRLTHLVDLGVHTGLMTSAMLPLIEKGIVTNAGKTQFRGKSIATMAAGLPELYAFLHDNRSIEFHPCDVTHSATVLAAIPQLCAINGALEIDLDGNVNAEVANGQRISAPGGQPDFASGGASAPGGKSIIALRATSQDGQSSRILPHLPPNTPRTIGARQVTHVVTEFGVAAVAGLTGSALAHAVADVAAPEFRPDLRRR